MFNPAINSGFSAYKTGGLLSLLKKVNFSSILNTTQKTLNVVNQAIPIVYQVKPLVNNAKTMFKVISAVKNDNNTQSNNQSYYKTNPSPVTNINNNLEVNYKKNTSEPVFFL